MSREFRVGILGATGAVGEELIALLAERNFPVSQLKLLASERSAGNTLDFKGETLTVEAVNADAFKGLDIIFASAGGSISKQWADNIISSGAVAIDNSSAFRMDPDTPLVIPEVNPGDARHHKGLIANPNCTTILMCVAVYPLHRVNPIRRIVVSTYQSASGAGARAMQELESQAADLLADRPANPQVFPHPIAFNLFLHNSPVNDEGYCQEEMKMVNEARKMMHIPDLRLTATCVRVPVLRAHAEAVNIEFDRPFDAAEAKQIIANAPGTMLIDDWQANRFPMPVDVSGNDDVAVGRIRQDISHPNCLDLWLCGDQIRKGAALNAIQIGELLIQEDLVRVPQLVRAV
ncbi:aspartate-semialdehyde dehydrogenase [Synechococcus sp. PCC 7336]|uniref:aspartate-semialdehyde dehydrogenase n=1 Tax=Synechococcus sp. PCC 7336 TaxID=195250 RepID=UPI00035DB8BC|nr:aspartate-semialdehyde dehydrogenase [Synechococcus sp. PCC 7336]